MKNRLRNRVDSLELRHATIRQCKRSFLKFCATNMALCGTVAEQYIEVHVET